MSGENHKTMKIVKATINEIPDIVMLWSFVQKIHHKKHPDIFKPVSNDSGINQFFQEIINDKNSYLFIAYIDAEAVGYALLALEDKPESPLKYGRRQFHIHQIAVHENHRRQQIGRALFNEIETLAHKKGIDHFEVNSWASNTDAHKFLNKLGFVPFNINMWRRLKPGT